MPGTGDDAVFDKAAAQRCTHVRADIVDREELALLILEQGDQLAADFKGSALPGGNILQGANRLELSHPHLPIGPDRDTGGMCYDDDRTLDSQGWSRIRPRFPEPIMLEVEMKFPLVDAPAFDQGLRFLGAKRSSSRVDQDQYFNAPDRDFAQTDEALRIRTIGHANYVTYKGPKRDALTKTRTEVEVPIASGEDTAREFAQLLTHLGYRRSAIVRKSRLTFDVERDGFAVEITLDDVDEVGRFVEIEIQASEEQLDKARTAVMAVAEDLGLHNSERRSYLELLLERRGGATR